MDFKFTTKRTLIFIAGLIASSAISQLLNSPPLAIGLMFVVIWYIAKKT